jgi:hypothetical protein
VLLVHAVEERADVTVRAQPPTRELQGPIMDFHGDHLVPVTLSASTPRTSSATGEGLHHLRRRALQLAGIALDEAIGGQRALSCSLDERGKPDRAFEEPTSAGARVRGHRIRPEQTERDDGDDEIAEPTVPAESRR